MLSAACLFNFEFIERARLFPDCKILESKIRISIIHTGNETAGNSDVCQCDQHERNLVLYPLLVQGVKSLVKHLN